MKSVIQRLAFGVLASIVSLGFTSYGLAPATVRAEDATITASETQPTDTTVVTPSDTPSTTSSVPGDTSTTSSADTSTAPIMVSEPTQVAGAETGSGPQSPIGDAADTYIFNETTGMWENSHYIWDPVTQQTSPKDPVNYSYNPATGMWETTQWVYDAAKGAYQPNIISIAPALLTADKLAGSDQPLAMLLSPITPTESPVPTSSLLNGTSSNSKTSGIFDLFNNATISNNIDSLAVTGDASVANNTTAGNATSGDASAVANVLNLLNSAWGAATAPVTFVANILGSVFGDLFINPAKLPNSSANTSAASDIKVNADTNNTINNNINLGANSGDAMVQLNTTAGSATSGDATVMANVMNLLNTSIGSGQSFLGMVNIYGDLNGDILLPTGFLDSLLASNAQTNSTINTSGQVVTSLDANLNNTTTINNQVNATAVSGQASVANNTTAGSATTGSADTNVTVFNMTGKQVVAKDALLVFVNVLGRWVGMIVNAPTGATAGMLGAGVSQNTNVDSSLTFNANNNATINNLINAAAVSGDATVSKNTLAGDAITGNAKTAVNLLNIANSSFSLSDWFGVLFINVFGNWYGSFGVDTAAGNPIKTPSVTNLAGSSKAFSFLTHNVASSNGLTYGPTASDPAPPDNNQIKVLGAHTTKPSAPIVAAVSNGFGALQYLIVGLFAASLGATLLYWLKARNTRLFEILN